jgi:hypothetical protein
VILSGPRHWIADPRITPGYTRRRTVPDVTIGAMVIAGCPFDTGTSWVSGAAGRWPDGTPVGPPGAA